MIASNKESQQKILLALKKAGGMRKKISAMVEQDQYCADIAQQVSATIGLLKSANTILLRNHLLCCGVKNLAFKDQVHVEDFVDELIKVRDISTRK